MAANSVDGERSSELQAALGHPYRRQLLRQLLAGRGGRSAAELRDRDCASCGLACVSYHLGVLADAGLIDRVPTGQIEGRTVHVFTAGPGPSAAVAELLAKSEASDRRMRLARS